MASGKIVLITGGNTGIGLETCKALLRSDRLYHILLGGRDINKAQDAAKASTAEIESKSSVEAIQVDVEEDESITKAFELVSSKHSRLDCLINNAGATYDPHIQDGRMSVREAWNKTWNVNVTGAHVMSQTFLPLLLKSDDPRLIFVTSGLSSLEVSADTSHAMYKVPPAGLPKQFPSTSYRSSKCGLNTAMLEWARILKDDNVKVWCIAPGLLATGLGGNPAFLRQIGAKEPSIGGTAIQGLVEGKRDADVGKVVREYDTPVQPW